MRQKIRARLPATLSLALVAACAAPAHDSSDSQVTDEIAAVRTAFVEAERRGDFGTQADLFAEDAVLLEPDNRIVVGRNAIRSGLEEFPIALESFSLTSEETGGGSTLAFDRGFYAFTTPDLGWEAPTRETGSYMMVLRRQPTKEWLIEAFIHTR